MLYATTRNKTDTYTAYRALYDDRAPDGGFYIPFRKIYLDESTVKSITDNTFSAVMEQILDIFFPGRITQWDVECCIGKSAVSITAMPHRVLLAQLWNNPEGDAGFIYRSIYRKLCNEESDNPLTDWGKLAIRIAVLFGIYGQLKKMGIQEFDVAINSGDFNSPMAVWYARQMGLPVGMIICGCNENSTPWDFLHRGELNTGASVVSTATQELDHAYPAGLERLIYETLGIDEIQKFLPILDKRGVYHIRPDMIDTISRGLFASVIGNERINSVLSSVYRANGCVLDPYTAVSYGSLQDYRSKTGESRPTLLLAEKSPLQFSSLVQQATGLTDIRKYLI